MVGDPETKVRTGTVSSSKNGREEMMVALPASLRVFNLSVTSDNVAWLPGDPLGEVGKDSAGWTLISVLSVPSLYPQHWGFS